MPCEAEFVICDHTIQTLNRYAYAVNNPLAKNDPDGHCAILCTAAIGAVAGGGIAYGSQVVANLQSGMSVDQALTQVDLGRVAAGAVTGAVAGATFGAGTAVLGTGLGATVASGAASGAIGGQVQRVGENVLSGQDLAAGLANPSDLVIDAALGGALGGTGYGLGRLARPAVAEAAGSDTATTVRGLLPAPKIRYHHIFPQQRQLRTWFAQRGIDIDLYTVPLEESTHLAGVHGRGGFVGPGNTLLPGRWNQRWLDFMGANPNATAKEIYQFGGQLMDEFGLSGLPIVPYPR